MMFIISIRIAKLTFIFKTYFSTSYTELVLNLALKALNLSYFKGDLFVSIISKDIYYQTILKK